MSKVLEELRPEDYDYEIEVPDEHPGYSGTDAATASIVKTVDTTSAYWLRYLDLLYAIGRYVRAYKLEYNAHSRGVYPTQVVLRKYFPDSIIDQATAWYRIEVWKYLRLYQIEAGMLGYRKINKRSWEKFFKWVACSKRLAALRGKARREMRARRLMDAEELVTWYIERHPTETKVVKFP